VGIQWEYSENRTFKAWLSSLDSSAFSRLMPSGNGPYKLRNEQTVAANWNDLTSKSLNIAIRYDEMGISVGAGQTVWTCTTPQGLYYDPNEINCCDQWTSEMGSGHAGSADTMATPNWSYSAQPICSGENSHLYCIEQ